MRVALTGHGLPDDVQRAATRDSGFTGGLRSTGDPHGPPGLHRSHGCRYIEATPGSGAGAWSAGAPAADGAVAPPAFAPGDRVVFFEDFAGTGEGEYPSRWTREVARAGGSRVEIVDEDGQHWLRLARGGTGIATDFVRSRFPDLPRRLTLELDAYVEPGTYGLTVLLGAECPLELACNCVRSCTGSQAELALRPGRRHVALSVDGTALAVYLDGERILLDPEGAKGPIDRIGVGLSNPWTAGAALRFTNVRLAGAEGVVRPVAAVAAGSRGGVGVVGRR